MGGPIWSAGSDAVVFTEANDNWRSYRARLHRVGTPPEADVTLYEETEDGGFQVGIGRSTDRSLIFLDTGDAVTSESRFVPANDPAAPPTLIARRRTGIRYGLDFAHGRLWIVANDDARELPARLCRFGGTRRLGDGDRRIGCGVPTRCVGLPRSSCHRGAA